MQRDDLISVTADAFEEQLDPTTKRPKEVVEVTDDDEEEAVAEPSGTFVGKESFTGTLGMDVNEFTLGNIEDVHANRKARNAYKEEPYATTLAYGNLLTKYEELQASIDELHHYILEIHSLENFTVHRTEAFAWLRQQVKDVREAIDRVAKAIDALEKNVVGDKLIHEMLLREVDETNKVHAAMKAFRVELKSKTDPTDARAAAKLVPSRFAVFREKFAWLEHDGAGSHLGNRNRSIHPLSIISTIDVRMNSTCRNNVTFVACNAASCSSNFTVLFCSTVV